VVEAEITQIKKEIIETHNLIIKTDNLVKNLSADIRNIQKMQERYERKYIFNSVVAYVIFVIIIFSGVYVAFDAKNGVIRREKEILQAKLDKVEKEAAELKKEYSSRVQQEKAAERFLRFKKDGKDLDALKIAEGIELNRLSAVQSELVGKEIEALRTKLAQVAYDASKALYNKAHLKRSLRELERALSYKPPVGILAPIHQHRGLVLSKLGKNAQAADAYLKAVAADPESSSVAYLLYMAGGLLEASGDVPQALSVYERILNEHPSASQASYARRRILRLSKPGSTVAPLPPPKPKPKPKPKPDTPNGGSSAAQPGD
jgi:tetratricopeptide (TPR) repeat protein